MSRKFFSCLKGLIFSEVNSEMVHAVGLNSYKIDKSVDVETCSGLEILTSSTKITMFM